MTAKADLPALVEELRVVTRPDASLSPEQRDAQALVYTKRLAAFDPRDVQAAIRDWPTEFWPAWSLLQAAVDDAALKRRQSETVNSNRPRRGEGFVERCLRLGFHAARLSAISAGCWRPILEWAEERDEQGDVKHPLSDDALRACLTWCEEHPGRAWRPPVPRPTPAAVRETARLVRDLRADPQNHVAPAALAAIGEQMLARHIAEGHAPPDVERDFPHLAPVLEAAE
jgi:hypothetical protein